MNRRQTLKSILAGIVAGILPKVAFPMATKPIYLSYWHRQPGGEWERTEKYVDEGEAGLTIPGSDMRNYGNIVQLRVEDIDKYYDRLVTYFSKPDW